MSVFRLLTLSMQKNKCKIFSATYLNQPFSITFSPSCPLYLRIYKKIFIVIFSLRVFDCPLIKSFFVVELKSVMCVRIKIFHVKLACDRLINVLILLANRREIYFNSLGLVAFIVFLTVILYHWKCKILLLRLWVWVKNIKEKIQKNKITKKLVKFYLK